MPRIEDCPGAHGGRSESVASLARGFALLRCFRPGDSVLGNKDLAERTGLPRPTVARFTRTLVELGYLGTTPERKYRLTSAVLDLGFAFLANFEIRALIRPYLQEMADFAMAGCSIGTLDDHSMLYLEQCRCRVFMLSLQVTVGTRVPVATTSMGRAYLAGLAPEQRARTMAMLEGQYPAQWSGVRKQVEAAVEQVRKLGFCTTLGTWQAGIHSVGVPLVTRGGARTYAITCAGPASVLTERKVMKEIGPKLVEVVRGAATMIL